VGALPSVLPGVYTPSVFLTSLIDGGGGGGVHVKLDVFPCGVSVNGVSPGFWVMVAVADTEHVPLNCGGLQDPIALPLPVPSLLFVMGSVFETVADVGAPVQLNTTR
jgi:hypothetical protein